MTAIKGREQEGRLMKEPVQKETSLFNTDTTQYLGQQQRKKRERVKRSVKSYGRSLREGGKTH